MNNFFRNLAGNTTPPSTTTSSSSASNNNTSPDASTSRASAAEAPAAEAPGPGIMESLFGSSAAGGNASSAMFLAQQQAAFNHYSSQHSNNLPATAPPPLDPSSLFQSLLSSIGGASANLQEAFAPHQPTSGPPPASASSLRSIPTITITPDDLSDEANKECCVCLEANELGSTVKRLPCGHLFHGPCIDTWITSHCSCPVCRYELPTEDAAYNRDQAQRMKERKQRFHVYELKRMGIGGLKNLCREVGVDSSRVCGCITKEELVDCIVKSGKVDIIAGGGTTEVIYEELKKMKVTELFGLLKDFGVGFDKKLIVDKSDLINLLINSGRVVVVEDGEGQEKEWGVMDIDDFEERKEEGKEEWIDVKRPRVSGDEPLAAETQWLGSSGLRRVDMMSMSIKALKKIAEEGGVSLTGVVEKTEIVQLIVESGTVLISDF